MFRSEAHFSNYGKWSEYFTGNKTEKETVQKKIDDLQIKSKNNPTKDVDNSLQQYEQYLSDLEQMEESMTATLETLTGNVTLANPTTETVGQSGFITFIQDGTGSRTVALGTDYETAGGAGLTLTSTASATDIVPYVVVASGRILLGTPQLAFA